MKRSHLLAAASLPWILASCSAETTGEAAEPAATAEFPADAAVQDAPPPTEQAQPEPMPAAEDAAPAEDPAFDLASVPFSSAALGDFPYFSLPDGYKAVATKTQDFGQAAFWTGDRFEIVEGRLYATGIQADKQAGKTFSAREVQRNIEHVVTSAGGVMVSTGEEPRNLPKDAAAEAAMKDHNWQTRCWGNNPADVHVLRRAEGTTWVRACFNNGFAGMIVVDAEAFEATAELLPASELKQQLDSTGKVALQVNFATDKTDILPESMPQIEQVVELLKSDATLALAVNGHTDDTGGSAHNQALSEGRAQSVVAAITAKGIDGSRLSAKGFGNRQPVADNGTEEGRAQNRRVELVKQ